MTHIFYIDESGDLGALGANPKPKMQPSLVIGGVIVDANRLDRLTHDFMGIKEKFFPDRKISVRQRRVTKSLDWVLPEIKGSEMFNRMRNKRKTLRKHAWRFMDSFMEILQNHEIKIVARIWVKGIDKPFKGNAVYTSSIQDTCTYFNEFLRQKNARGICIVDSRDQILNVNMVHSMFTKKFSKYGHPEAYDMMDEVPLLGHSDNHVGIQISDILCSGLLFPIANHTYCAGKIQNNVHIHPEARDLKARYGKQLKDMQFRFTNKETGRLDGGIVVSDAMTERPGWHMFS